MQIEMINETCTGCSSCQYACPKNCIHMELDDEGFYYPVIDHEKCISCGKCEGNCHIIQETGEPRSERISYYGWNRDDIKRKMSSSGGIFIALAEEILSRGGNVYGAYFDLKQRRLYHTSTDKVALEMLLKSKYTESNISGIQEDIQKDITSGREVLFCGTPCQVSGVRRVIRDPRGLLTTCDFLCHGVPSSLLLQDHLKYVHGDYELEKLDFRPKDLGWSGPYIRFITKTRFKKRELPWSLDSFYDGFMTKNAFLRRSCYHCNFRKKHFSDITIADFWQYKKLDEKLNNEKGISLVIVHNSKSHELIHAIGDRAELISLDNTYSDYVFNEKDYGKAKKLREEFYDVYKVHGFEKAARATYFKGKQKAWIKYFIHRLFKLTGKSLDKLRTSI